MAERVSFIGYCMFTWWFTIIYSVAAGWVWGAHGFLNQLGVVDISGSGPVHLIGGASALAASIMLGPRLGRYKNGIKPPPPGNLVLVFHGFIILWMTWFIFNSASTYGSTGHNWQYCARAALVTMLSSFGGGIASFL